MNQTKTRALAALAVTALAVVGLTACGSSSSDSTSSTLSTDDFVSQTNAICKEHGAAIDKAAKAFTSAPTGADLRGFVKDTVLPQYAAQIGQIQVLAASDDISDDVNTWLTDSTAAHDAIAGDPSTALKTDTFTKVNQEADGLGLGTDCQAGPTS